MALTNMPTQHRRRRFPPMFLRFYHEKCAGDDETRATNNLRDPICAIKHARGREVVVYAWECGEARYPEDGGTKHLRRACQKTQIVDVMRFQFIPRWPPNPRICAGRRANHWDLCFCTVGCGYAAIFPFTDEIPFVRMVMGATIGAESSDSSIVLFIEDMLERPAEAPRSILVDGFKHQ